MTKTESLKRYRGDIVKRYQTGETKKSLAEFYNVGVRIIKKILDQEGVKNNAIRYGNEQKENALNLARNGCSDIEIAEEVGISLYLANQFVKRAEKEIQEAYENEKLIKAKDLRNVRRYVVNGKCYSDLTDFYAGV